MSGGLDEYPLLKHLEKMQNLIGKIAVGDTEVQVPYTNPSPVGGR